MKNNSRTIIRVIICILLILGICFSSLVFFQHTVLAANTGNIKYLNTHPDYYGWQDIGYSSVPLPLGFEPAYIIGTPPCIYIYNPSNSAGTIRKYDDTTWSSVGYYTYPIPTGYLPLGIASSYRLVINPSTGTILRLSNNGWADFGWSSIPIPAGFSPLGYIPYSTNSALIINTATGAIKMRYESSTNWIAVASNIPPMPPGYEPLGYYDSRWYIIDSNRIPTLSITSPIENPTYTEQEGSNILTISGNTTDSDIGDTLTVKYTIEGLAAYTNVVLTTLTASGSAQSFSTDLTIDSTIPEGSYTLRVWVEDNNRESSSQATATFSVDKSLVEDTTYINVIAADIHNFAMDTETGSYTDVTDTNLINAFGSEKPFYLRSYTYKFNGSSNTFFDYGSTATYIGDNTLRVVTSEGKAFDVDRELWTYNEVTDSFLNDNFGSGKPFYHRVYEQDVNNSGPFTFHDFGSTMAYIGNNIIRVITSEGKAFDVNKDTGDYTDVTSTFLVNNFGSGKPFYLRTYSCNIGSGTNTFYDWGVAMTYIGNNILRVVTSEGKAFDVDKDTGAYTDITSSFLLGNFGDSKPFYLRTYQINSSSNNLYDFGCTMSYSQAEIPSLLITSPMIQTCFDTITLTGTVCDKDGDDVTVSSTIAGVTKLVVVSNTATPQPWILEWDISVDNIPDGIYTNIEVQQDDGNDETCTAYYQGNIYVFGPGSNVARKDINYEYDENGKLNRRSIITYP